MSDVPIDSGGSVNLDSVLKVEFATAYNPPINARAFLDGVSVSPIAALNTIREVVGSGEGKTGWVKVREPGASRAMQDVYVQLSKVDSVLYINSEDGEIAVLKKGNEVLGEVYQANALATVKVEFPP